MDSKNTRSEKLAIIFATHPDKNEVYMTSDDRAFFVKHQAEGFAQALKDRKVTTFTRAIVEAFASVKEKTQHFEEGKKEPVFLTKTGTSQEPEDEITGINSAVQGLEELNQKGDEGQKETTEANATTEAGTGKDATTEENKDQQGAQESDEAAEKAAVSAEFEKVIGKKPNNFMKVETMKAKIAEALEAN